MKRNKICGIYKMINKLDGKIYVGQSIDCQVRMIEVHFRCRYLYHAIKKHGRENFESSIIEICEVDKLDEREIYWIKELKSHVSENGYNISYGGNATMKGLKHTEESKKKISDAVKGEKHPLWGTHQSEESKKKNRESQLGEKSHCFGKHLSDEMKQKLSEIRHADTDHISNKRGVENPKFGIKNKNATSKYFAVYFRSRIIRNRKYEYWCVAVTLPNGKTINKQTNNEIDAAKIVDKIIIDNNLVELGYPLNFPEDHN